MEDEETIEITLSYYQQKHKIDSHCSYFTHKSFYYFIVFIFLSHNFSVKRHFFLQYICLRIISIAVYGSFFSILCNRKKLLDQIDDNVTYVGIQPFVG